MKKQNGITLVALVITIIILIILAGITIASLSNTGLFTRAQEAKNVTDIATNDEKVKLNEYETTINAQLDALNASQLGQ